MRPRHWIAAIAVLAALAAAAALALGSSAGPRATVAADGSAGLQAGSAPWPAEQASLGPRLAALGLPAASDSGYHVHLFLAVFAGGRRVPVPAGIGIDPAGPLVAPVHTHDATGIVHLESARAYPFTLAQLFRIWGVRFGDARLGGYRDRGARRLAVYADGAAVPDPVHHVLRAHERLVVGFGAPGSFPHDLPFTFPPGL